MDQIFFNTNPIPTRRSDLIGCSWINIRHDRLVIIKIYFYFYYAEQQVKDVLTTNESKFSLTYLKVDYPTHQLFYSHKLWIEQPENYPTCLAVKPYPKELNTDVKKIRICALKIRNFSLKYSLL